MIYIFSFFQVASDMDKISSSPLLWQIGLSDELLYAKKNGTWESIQNSWSYIHQIVTVRHHKLLSKWDLGDSFSFNEKYFAVLTEKIDSQIFEIDREKLIKAKLIKDNEKLNSEQGKNSIEKDKKEEMQDLSALVPKNFWESSNGLRIID